MRNRRAFFAIAVMAFIVYLVLSYSNRGKEDQIMEGRVMPDITLAETPPEILQPVRIAASPEGDIFVSDYVQNQIITLNSTLKPIKSFIVDGKPLGIAWGQGKLFVGNETNHSVEVYTRNGKLLYSMGVAVQYPTDIVIDNDQDLVFVVDGQAHIVKVFDISGNLVARIPKPGINQQHLYNPTGIAIDPARGQVVISDFGDPLQRAVPAIKVYDYGGIFRFAIFSTSVQTDFRFSRPQGLAISSAGNFFLVDSMLGKVLVFNRNTLQGMKSLGSFGTGTGQLKLPLDLIINPANSDVIVTNTRNARLEVFSGGGTP